MKGTLVVIALLWTASLGLAQKVSNAAPVRDPLLRPSGQQPTQAKFIDRVACSSLCLYKQPIDKALKVIADMGYQLVDLSCMKWAPHVDAAKLAQDFEGEASRVEAVLASNGLHVANLTFDSVNLQNFDAYQKEFEAVLRLAVRLQTRLINLMAAPAKVDRQAYVDKLRKLQALAAKADVLLTVETHCNQITEKPADALWLCRQVPGLGLTLDPSHYYAGPNQGASFDELYPFVQGTGFRAGGRSWSEIQLRWGEGPIDFKAVVQKLEAAGYKGFYVAEYIEGFSQTVDALGESRRFLEWAKGL